MDSSHNYKTLPVTSPLNTLKISIFITTLKRMNNRQYHSQVKPPFSFSIQLSTIAAANSI